VEYGTTTAYGSSTTLNTSLVTAHSANLSGLLANTTYHYRVKSRDAAGNLRTSGDFTFTTAASQTPTNWGAIDYQTYDNLNLAGTERWYTVTSSRAGLLTVESFFTHSAGNIDLRIYSATDQLLDTSATATNAERVDVTAAAAGTVFKLQVLGANSNVDFRLANLVTVSGTTATVAGTSSNDTVQFIHAAKLWIVVNAVAYSFVPGTLTVANIDAGAGADTFQGTLNGQDDDVTFRPGSVDIVNAMYQIHVTSVATTTVTAGAGADEAWLHDSAGNDTLIATRTSAVMSGAGYSNSATNFEKTYSFAMQGGMDIATLFDSSGNDYFVGNPGAASLGGSGFFNWTQSFDEVHARATSGGWDQSDLTGSTGVDLFQSVSNFRALSGTGYKLVAEGLERVSAFGNGGADVADLRGFRNSDKMYGRNGFAKGTLAKKITWAFNFAQVMAYAATGQRPTADVRGVDYLFSKFGAWK
jgi:hypothetical protein